MAVEKMFMLDNGMDEYVKLTYVPNVTVCDAGSWSIISKRNIDTAFKRADVLGIFASSTSKLYQYIMQEFSNLSKWADEVEGDLRTFSCRF